MVDEPDRRLRSRIDASTGWRRRPRPRPRRRSTSLYVGVGYPDTWRDYSGLEIVRGDASATSSAPSSSSTSASSRSWASRSIGREWWMTPQTVNAVNLPLQNALNFPPPSCSRPSSIPPRSAANYGAIGAMIGHEISHSFDDSGSQFDAPGQSRATGGRRRTSSTSRPLARRWRRSTTPTSPFPDLRDQRRAGAEREHRRPGRPRRRLRRATTCRWVASRPTMRTSSSSFAQSWRGKAREEPIRLQVTTDGHSPDTYRARRSATSIPWYAAFNVTPAQKMLPAAEKRVRVW